MLAEKTKSLYYRRAVWFPQPVNGRTLEWWVREALKQLPTVGATRVTIPDGPVLEVAHRGAASHEKLFLHLTGYTPGETASVVPTQASAPEVDIFPMLPPKDGEFMDGDIMLRLNGNHILLCPSGLRESVAVQYLRALLEARGFGDASRNFTFERVADIKKAKLLHMQGVKKVHLDVALYKETVEEVVHRKMQRTVSGELAELVRALVFSDKKKAELMSAENLHAKLIVSFDSRRKGGELAQEKLESFALRVASQEEEGFVIETAAGEKVRSDEIALKKNVSMPSFTKTVPHQAAWSALEEYFHELKKIGAIES